MSKDRGYVLRFRAEGAGQDEYIPGKTFTVEKYRCGLRAGQQVRLKKDLPLLDSAGNVTGNAIVGGTVWTVLPGAVEDPEALWLEQPDGKVHSWSDDESVFELFEAVIAQPN